MNYTMTKTILLAALPLILASCKVSDPGSALANRPPTTAITSAPQNGTTVNHFISIFWSGNDSDGEVTGFNMYIDGELVAFTTRSDSAISFNSPATGEVVSHTFKIQAVDNDGDVDPTPPEIQFNTSNTAPTCFFSSDNIVGNNATVGQGFSIKLEAEDTNRSIVWFSLSLDDTMSWTDWSRDSTFLFADLSLGSFPGGMVPLDNSVLTAGQHTLYGRCRDSGFAVSGIASRRVTVTLDSLPRMDVVQARYNSGVASDSLYPDGSIYWQLNAELVLSFGASAFHYRGLIHSYRYRGSDGLWSQWAEEPALALTNLPIGDYNYSFQARDMAGLLSDTTELFVRLVGQTLSDSVLVVDETRNGNGAPTLPTDAQVDDFYAALVDGYNVRHIDMTVRTPGAYVSPFDLSNIGLVVWHADDRTDFQLDDNRRILAEYMRRGGRVIFSGWDIMSAIVTTAEASFTDSDFAFRYMRAFECSRDPAPTWSTVREATGFTGENGFPSLRVDPDKILPSWNGAIPRSWTFDPRGECTIIGRLTSITPDYFQNGQVAGYYYDLSFRVAVFGIPLFFCHQQDAEALFDVLMPRMLTGL